MSRGRAGRAPAPVRWMVRRLGGMPALFIGVAAACGGGDGQERLGDRAYVEARFADAVTAYRAVAKEKPRPALWTKLGEAALHAGQLRESAEAYLHLVGDDPTRADEAAEGLDGVARAAERTGNVEVLQEVVNGLEATVPHRGAEPYALVLARRPDPDTTELVALLPGALAVAIAPETVDSLLVLYGRALESTAGCGQALPQYRSVLRRSQDSGVRAPARRGAGDCAYRLGVRADSAGGLEHAALWFAEAARSDSNTPTGRRALLRYADARLRQGDTLAAALAFQAVAAAGAADSMGAAAVDHLTTLGLITLPDDTTGTGAR